MIIYKTIFPNGKIYIGQTTKNDSNYFGSGVKCLEAIKKFGKKNLKREILRECKTQKELDIWEFIYIRKLKSTNLKIGYNILTGTSNQFGSGSPMLIPNVVEKVKLAWDNKNIEEISIISKNMSTKTKIRMSKQSERDKISNTLKGKYVGDKNPNFGNNWSEKQKEQLRNKMIGRYNGKDNPNYGNNWNEEQKQNLRDKIGDKNKGKNNAMYGKKRITNGKVNTVIDNGEELPKGFRFGLTRGLK